MNWRWLSGFDACFTTSSGLAPKFSAAELQALSERYKKIAGYDKTTLKENNA